MLVHTVIRRALVLFSLVSFALGFSAVQAAELNQAAYINGTTTYQFGYNSIPKIGISGAPADTDWGRWAMVHDGSVYRLYFFKRDTSDTLYQFGFNVASSRYEWGYNSIATLKIHGAPSGTDSRSFAMLHDGTTYRLYLRSHNDPTLLRQFGFNAGTSRYEYGYNSIPEIRVTGFPSDTDWNRWAMVHDGRDFRFYAFKNNLSSQFYQGSFSSSAQQYQYQLNSIPVLELKDIPGDSATGSAAMLHDGSDFRFYFLSH